MIHSADPVASRCERLGAAELLPSPGKPFFLGAKAIRSLVKLIAAQHDAFLEAQTGRPRPKDRAPFTAADLHALEPLLGWLKKEAAANTSCVFPRRRHL